MKFLVSILVPLLLTLSLRAAGGDSTIVHKRFSRKELTADVDYLVKTIANVHPNMYHSITKVKYQLLTDSVLSQLHDGMTDKQAWPLIARLVGALNEGHSGLSYPDSLVTQLKNGGRMLFPELIKEFNGTNFIVRADASNENKLQPGDQITAINGISSSKLVDLLSGYTGGLKLYRAIDVCRNLITYLYLYNINGPYRIDYLRGGKLANVVLNNITWAELRSNMAAKSNTLPKAPQQVSYAFKYLNKDRAYLEINTLAKDPAEFKHFLDSCFTLLKNGPAKTLLIDLRRNGGGNSALGETLLTYITTKPFRMAGGVRFKVSQEYKDQLNERMKGDGAKNMAFYFDAPNGSIIKDDGVKPKVHPVNPLLYQGRVVVLIGPHTFSSANMLANAIQDYRLATLAGEPSGEPANDYGELIFLRLPNTGFSLSTSTKQFVRANGDATNQQPVLPNHIIKAGTLTTEEELLGL